MFFDRRQRFSKLFRRAFAFSNLFIADASQIDSTHCIGTPLRAC